jgi:hypothetical protein
MANCEKGHTSVLMSNELLTAKEAAKRLGIAVTTFYELLGRSDCGLLLIRGQPVSVRYYQGGRSGQGKIQIEATEIERIRELMRVVPRTAVKRRPSLRPDHLPGITVPLGRPAEKT